MNNAIAVKFLFTKYLFISVLIKFTINGKKNVTEFRNSVDIEMQGLKKNRTTSKQTFNIFYRTRSSGRVIAIMRVFVTFTVWEWKWTNKIFSKTKTQKILIVYWKHFIREFTRWIYADQCFSSLPIY